ncbi:MAG: hypothetical protein C4532_11940 [Candidatus Abyssobacteria bacterium SURF_17]|uniref:Uncharacterized protein n=1 Tax=Candidatus Abyssobacteria bacterium SURF_17 TaxID=2093361 RepID=A0A419EWM7_9BACT|nr:MAG: hypothetical protein C4532_11940 [Candidatus Abyssubacteria bacterium SURF_17]
MIQFGMLAIAYLIMYTSDAEEIPEQKRLYKEKTRARRRTINLNAEEAQLISLIPILTFTN